MKVAIDGPAGAGKSTVAKAIARECGFVFLDTGAMYRSVALLALESGSDLSDEGTLEQIAIGMRLEFVSDGESGQRVFVDGRDVTSDIRTPSVDSAVSTVSSVPGVRNAMLAMQRAFGTECDVVAEGRDIGTVVFPDAEVKVFLTADARARARRRVAQNTQRFGTTDGSPSENEVYEAILKRDEADSNRKVAPLVAAEDAVCIDSSNMTIEEVVGMVREMIDRVESN